MPDDFIDGVLSAGIDENYQKMMKDCCENRILILNKDIGNSVLEDYILWILKWNAEDKDLPTDKRKPILIYINSLGGDVISGFSLVDAIEQSKTKIIGVCLGMAASMAYYIMLSCHERVGFCNSVLLQHDGGIICQNSNSKAKDTMRFYDAMDLRIKNFVLSHTNMTQEYYDETFDQEHYMYADEAKSFGCLDKIIGLDCDMDEYIR